VRFYALAAAVMLPLLFLAEADAATPPTWGSPGPVTTVQSSETPANPMGLRTGLSRRERREAGASFLNVIRLLKEIKAEDPEGFKDNSPGSLSVIMLDRLVAEMPPEMLAADRDWAAFFTALLAFLEPLIAMIIKYFPLFL